MNRAGSSPDITRQWQDIEVLIFCYKSILQKIGHMLKWYGQVSFWSYRQFKGYRRQTGPRESETDSSWLNTWHNVTLTWGQILTLTFQINISIHTYIFRRVSTRGIRYCQNFDTTFLSSKIICENPSLHKSAIFTFLGLYSRTRWSKVTSDDMIAK